MNHESFSPPEHAWAVNDANVQSYRAFGVTSQSLLLVCGVVAAASSLAEWAVCGLAAIGLAQLLLVWCQPVWARVKIVDYYKLQCGLTEAEQRQFQRSCREAEYVRDPVARARANEALGRPGLSWLRETRRRFDVLLPLMYATAWAVVIGARLAK
ncbi:MAG: hypothetical protein KBG48_19270 [Kofleriaceae bacterium]|nr:hypothetical protein [Kofleriaceae bacterium]MBP9169550.1 hypothetical protein [Kofleriaceae bacterium]MBP9859195.1 hypothetical protein [Kofleriaceae bacterium]